MLRNYRHLPYARSHAPRQVLLKLSGPFSATPLPVWLENGRDVGTLVAKVPILLLEAGRYIVQTSVFSSSSGQRLASHGAHIHVLSTTASDCFPARRGLDRCAVTCHV